MPNWVYSAFKASGEPSELAKFRNMAFRTVPSAEAFGSLRTEGEETILDFGAVIPPPPGTQGHPDRDWAVENWGVKWNAIDLLLHGDPADGEFRFQFVTAWDFPGPVFEKLAAEFPDIVFDGSAREESGEFALAGQFNGDWSWDVVEGADADEDEDGLDEDDGAEDEKDD